MNGDDETKRDAKEILLKEYDSLSESIWKNEQAGETRVNWFIGIVTVAVGGVLKLIVAEHRPEGAEFCMAACLFALLAFGIVTFARIVSRNKRTDRMSAELDLVRKIFRFNYDRAGVLLADHAFTRDVASRRKRQFGGLADLVLTINSLLSGAFFFATSFAFVSNQLLPGAVPAVVGFVYCFLWQYYFAHVRSDHTHAGGIVYRLDDAVVKYLLVGPKRPNAAREEWILPKGHIEARDHGEENTAVREVKEETGVAAHVVAPVGVVNFRNRGEEITAAFYLMRMISDDGPGDDRATDWFSLDDALRCATHSATRQLLRAAEIIRLS